MVFIHYIKDIPIALESKFAETAPTTFEIWRFALLVTFVLIFRDELVLTAHHHEQLVGPVVKQQRRIKAIKHVWNVMEQNRKSDFHAHCFTFQFQCIFWRSRHFLRIQTNRNSKLGL